MAAAATVVSRSFAATTSVVGGRVMPLNVTPQKVKKLQSDFHVRADDVFVVSYPKSGTTWVQQIVRLVQCGGTLPDSDTKISDAIPWIEGAEMPAFGCNMSLREIDEMPSPRTFKSHLPYDIAPGGAPHTSPARYIYVARNPKDTVVSFYAFVDRMSKSAIGFDPFSWDFFLKSFTRGKLWFGDWYDHVLRWWSWRNEPNVLFLKYEDIKKDLPGTVRKVADFLGQELEPEVVMNITRQCSFQGMKSNPTTNYGWAVQNLAGEMEARYPLLRVRQLCRSHHRDSSAASKDQIMMRKGVVGDWKNYFTAKQSTEFDKVYRVRMEGSGLDFEFEPLSEPRTLLSV